MAVKKLVSITATDGTVIDEFSTACHELFSSREKIAIEFTLETFVGKKAIKEKMVDKQSLTLKSNWSTLGNNDLSSIILHDKSGSLDIDIEEMSAENCVCLVSNEGDTSTAHLDINVYGQLTNIVMISEAQIIEVFGMNDEYLFTHISEFFDDWEDMSVYYSKMSLPNIPVCKLKFTRARNDNRLWIYGAKLHIKSIPTNNNLQPGSPVQFNMEQISRLMGNSNLNNSLNNRNINLNSLLQFCVQNLPNNNMTPILGQRRQKQSSETNSDDSNQESHIAEALTKFNIHNVLPPASSEYKFSKNVSADNCSNSWFAMYMDKKLNEIKSDILHEVDLKLKRMQRETNDKLDRIIALLENNKMNMENV